LFSNFRVIASKKLTPSININEYYKNAFGIETQGQPYMVILKLDNAQKKYLQSLPLHHSQKIVEEKENYFIIELFLHLNFDFRMEILKLGSLCEVLEPKQLRAEIKEVINRMYKVYK
jgi:predicted DNA-binding transcriptional regulator YafY